MKSENIMYLTAEEVMEIHALLIERFGGSLGLRDRGLLESACFRPQSGYYLTLFEQAAALLDSLSMNHVFTDGNKRIAWTATKVFLNVNGYHLTANAKEAETFLIGKVIKQRIPVQTISKWLEKHSRMA